MGRNGPRLGGWGRGCGGQRRRVPRIIKPVSAKVLEKKIDECHPLDLLLWLTADRAVDMLLRSRAPDDESRRLLFAAVRKACRSGKSETLNHLLISVCESAIFDGLPKYLTRAYTRSMSECKDNTVSIGMDQQMRALTDLVDHVVEVLGHMMTSLPTESASSVSQLLFALENLPIPDPHLERLKPAITNIKDIVKITIKIEADEDETSSDIPCKNGDKVEHSDDFRQMNIIPNLDDMSNFNPHLTRIDEKFPDLEAYLDTQFRLIREDFIRPLREDIGEYKEKRKRAPKEVYHGVRILPGDMTLQVWLSATSS